MSAENSHVSEIVAKEDLAVTVDGTDVTPNMVAFNNGNLLSSNVQYISPKSNKIKL